MQMDALAHAKWEERQQMWGYHLIPSWQAYFDAIKSIGQITKDIKAEDVIKNDYVAGANDFDHDKVKADADGFQLSAEFEALPAPSPEASPAS